MIFKANVIIILSFVAASWWNNGRHVGCHPPLVLAQEQDHGTKVIRGGHPNHGSDGIGFSSVPDDPTNAVAEAASAYRYTASAADVASAPARDFSAAAVASASTLGGSLKVRSSLSFNKEEMNPGNVGSGSDFVPHDGKNESAEHPMDPGIVGSNFGSVVHPVDEENVGPSTVPRDRTNSSVERRVKYLKNSKGSKKPSQNPSIIDPEFTPPPTASIIDPEFTPPPTTSIIDPEFTPPPTAAIIDPEFTPPPTTSIIDPEFTPPPTVPMYKCNEDKDLVVGKRSYVPGCQNFINEVSIDCDDAGVCSYFQEAIQLTECGEEAEETERCQLIGQFFLDSSKPVSDTSSNPTCSQEILVFLTSFGRCSFKDGDKAYGAPNALRAEIEPDGQMAIYYSADHGKSFYSDARVAKVDDGSRRSLVACNACGNVALTSCDAKSEFCEIIGIKDLMKGFKTSGSARGMQSFVFKVPELRWNKSYRARDNMEYVTDSKSAKKSLGISAEISLSYGPFAGSLSGRYSSEKTSSSDYFRYTVTLTRQWGSITANSDLDLKYLDRYTDSTQQELFDAVGARYVSEIILGAKMTISFEKTSSISDDKEALAGALKGAVKKLGAKLEINGKINAVNGETKKKSTLKLGIAIDGVRFVKPSVPTGKNPDWMGYMADLVDLFDEKANEQFALMDDFAEANPIPNTDANFTLLPVDVVAFFAARIQTPMQDWDPEVGPKISAQLSEAGELLGDVTFLLDRLTQQKDIFSDLAKDDPIFSQKYTGLWLPAFDHWSTFLNSKRDAIFDFSGLSNLELIEGNIPPPTPLNATVENSVEELLGNGIIAPVVLEGKVIEDLLWSGFVVDGEPFWKGNALCADLSYDVTVDFWELEDFITVDQCVSDKTWVEIQGNANVLYSKPGESFATGDRPTVIMTAYSSSANDPTTTADKAIDRTLTGDGNSETSVYSFIYEAEAWFYIDIRPKKIVNNPNEPNTKMWQLSNEPRRITKIEIDRRDAGKRQRSREFAVSVVNWSKPPQDSPDKYGAFKPECSNTIGPNGGFDGVQGEIHLCQPSESKSKPGDDGKGITVWKESWNDSVVPFTTTHLPVDGTRGQYVVVKMIGSGPLYISDIRVFSDEKFFDPQPETFAPIAPTPAPTPAPDGPMGIIKDIAEDGSSLNLCEGNCDSDSDCKGDLICFEKSKSKSQDVPSCSYPSNRAGYNVNWNYCTYSKYRVKKQSRSTGLDICDGNCSRNSDCSGDLICYKDAMNTVRMVPGCTFSVGWSKSFNYCVDKKYEVRHLGWGGMRGLCEGDCANSDNCYGHLICQQSDYFDTIHGCVYPEILQQSGSDMCVEPRNIDTYPTAKGYQIIGGTASQSSTYSTGVASLAIDGNLDAAYTGGSVTHTNGELNPWWKVVLDREEIVQRIRVYNRGDSCCRSRLDNAIIDLFDGNGTLVFTRNIGTAENFKAINLERGYSVKEVKIRLLGKRVLSLAEVELFA